MRLLLLGSAVIYFWDGADFTDFSSWHLHFCCCPFMRTFKAVTETQSGMWHLNFKGLTEHIASISHGRVLFLQKVPSELISPA